MIFHRKEPCIITSMNGALRGDLREEMGRHREPSGGLADSQSVKTTSKRGHVATTAESS